MWKCLFHYISQQIESCLKCLGLVCWRQELSEDVVLSKPQSKSCPVILVSLHYWLKALKPFNTHMHTYMHTNTCMHTQPSWCRLHSDTKSCTCSVTSQHGHLTCEKFCSRNHSTVLLTNISSGGWHHSVPPWAFCSSKQNHSLTQQAVAHTAQDRGFKGGMGKVCKEKRAFCDAWTAHFPALPDKNKLLLTSHWVMNSLKQNQRGGGHSYVSQALSWPQDGLALPRSERRWRRGTRHTETLQLTLARVLPLYLETLKPGSGREETWHNHCIHTLCSTTWHPKETAVLSDPKGLFVFLVHPHMGVLLTFCGQGHPVQSQPCMALSSACSLPSIYCFPVPTAVEGVLANKDK